jgi:hypothetical protein
VQEAQQHVHEKHLPAAPRQQQLLAHNQTHDLLLSACMLLVLLQGTNGWAPIMGLGYYQPLTQWSKGEYQGADNLQDDVAIIASKLRYSWAGNGNTTATATTLMPTIWANGTANGSAMGIVQQPGALDMFRVQAGVGLLSFSVSGLVALNGYERSDLEPAVRILNSAGVEIASTQNTAGLGVTGTAMLPAAGAEYTIVDWRQRTCSTVECCCTLSPIIVPALYKCLS